MQNNNSESVDPKIIGYGRLWEVKHGLREVQLCCLSVSVEHMSVDRCKLNRV